MGPGGVRDAGIDAGVCPLQVPDGEGEDTVGSRLGVVIVVLRP